MLTDLEKQKITLEETYRNEVKGMLQKKEGKRSLLWFIPAFFNSAFGLWLLSAIFLTGGVKLYEDYKTKSDDLTRSDEEISKLDLEIGYRFSQAVSSLYELSDKRPGQERLSKEYGIEDVKKVIHNMESSANTGGVFLYTEYANRSLLALLAEEDRLMKHVGLATDPIERVIGHLSQLTAFFDVRKANFVEIRAVAGFIQDELWLPRWKNAGFYFSEGSSTEPFP